MTKEYQSIMKNDVWDIVPRPEGKSVVTSKWIYKIKHAVDGSVEKYKARFVALMLSGGGNRLWDICSCCPIHFHPYDYFSCNIHGLETTSDGCEDNLPQWRDWRRSIHQVARWFHDTWEGVSCVQVEEGPVWTQACTLSLVCEDWWTPDEFGLQKKCCWSQPILQNC